MVKKFFTANKLFIQINKLKLICKITWMINHANDLFELFFDLVKIAYKVTIFFNIDIYIYKSDMLKNIKLPLMIE